MTEVIACLGCFADRTMEAGRKDPKKYPMSYKLYKRAMQNATCCIHSKDTSMDRVLLYGLGNALRICGMTILQSSPDKKTVQLIHSEAKHMGIEHQYNPQELILHNHELQEKRIVDDKRRELGAAGEAKFTAWLRDEYTPAMLKRREETIAFIQLRGQIMRRLGSMHHSCGPPIMSDKEFNEASTTHGCDCVRSSAPLPAIAPPEPSLPGSVAER